MRVDVYMPASAIARARGPGARPRISGPSLVASDKSSSDFHKARARMEFAGLIKISRPRRPSVDSSSCTFALLTLELLFFYFDHCQS